MKHLTLPPLPGAFGGFTVMPWAISGLTRMHHFFSRPATLRLVAIFLEAPSRSVLLPSSFSLKLLDLVFSLSLHCITGATSKFCIVMPSQSWGPPVLRQSVNSAMVFTNFTRTLLGIYRVTVFHRSLGDGPPSIDVLILRFTVFT